MSRDYFVGLGLGLFGIVVVIVLGLLLYFGSKRVLKLLLRHQYLNQATYVIAKLSIRWLCTIIVAVLVLQQLGMGLPHILAGLLTVAGMVAIGFIAVWSVLSNVMCALLLAATGAFRVGEEIEVIEPAGSDKGLRGRVRSFNLMYTTLTEIPTPPQPLAEADPGSPAVTPAPPPPPPEPEFLVQVPNNVFFQKSLRRRSVGASESLSHHLLSRSLSFRLPNNGQ
ncbi:MAG TPA: mechanosensitive ion channel family protein [Desulfurivibrio alkaliphilus]|uniref:Mechanosensitive ion channel family protein n=1 Tax=Desulfurivibrio alkaliphilus TaxID=427923 RepID=A0A7C2TFD7_9BACT|nr:mechanosensitive ion channel family protein [Desulfurivibrio alkaliphilus]